MFEKANFKANKISDPDAHKKNFLPLLFTKKINMKLITCLTVLALGALTIFSACGNDGDAARDAAVESLQPGQPATGDAAATPPAATPEPPQNATGVWHYTCPKGCEGGAGSAVACAKCGTTLVHNTAYHPPVDAVQTPPATTSTALPDGITPTPAPAQTPEPAQNAKGVWHYTCSAGCAGGGGSAVACAKCGKTLAHNQTYHQ